MTIRLARVDDRLIHGQVLHGWVPRLQVDQLVVADDDLYESEEEQSIALLAVPPDVKVRFVQPARVSETLTALNGSRVMVLFRTPLQALEAIATGFVPESLNLGNLHFAPGKIQLRKTFCCSDKELKALQHIAERGVKLDYQPAPDLKRISICLSAT